MPRPIDSTDLKKVIERNQWYSRTNDDVLPELAKSKYKTLKDVISGYCHIVLDLASSLLTTFNTLGENSGGWGYHLD